MEVKIPDFSGYVTKADIQCSDGRTIKPNAFEHQDGLKVPLVWQHGQDDPDNVLGHVFLENRADGVYGRAFFNNSPKAQNAKHSVQHEDIDSMSIWANKLVEKAKQVLHGTIREVSLVMAGANPGAKIDFVNLAHSEDGLYWERVDPEDSEDAFIFTGLTIKHDDDVEPFPEEAPEGTEGEEAQEGEEGSGGEAVHADGETLMDIINTFPAAAKDALSSAIATASQGGTIQHGDKTVLDLLDTKQKDVASFVIGVAANGSSAQHSDDNNDEGNLSHKEGQDVNVFEDGATGATKDRSGLSHAQRAELTAKVVADMRNGVKLKDSFLAHTTTYGIEDIDLLFPDAKTIDSTPEFVARRMEWVQTVLSGVRRNPFSRIKTISADITADEARAKGYVKASMKKEEWFGLNTRSTSPTTIYKKQKLDRDDILDITDFDVVAWVKGEMRIMLDEEVARAILLGDGREVDDEDKIADGSTDGVGIRPIAFEDEFYAHRVVMDANVSPAGVVEAAIRNRKYYRGAGNPAMFCSEDVLADLLLDTDDFGRRLYNSVQDLAVAMRVSSITSVPVMEGLQADDGEVQFILVNLSDYTVGADKGAALGMFEDFDIDYNQQKYLLETRFSGALTKFKTAMVFVRADGTLVTPTVPTFVSGTGVVTIPSVTGVVYKNKQTGETLSSGAQSALSSGATLHVKAEPASGYYFPHNFDDDWDFTRP